jgi:hypothetical protein
MAVFPLLYDKENTTDYLLLDEALEKELIVITEVDEDGDVPELKVENRSKNNLLILDGEELVGAKQNRVVNVTILIAAQARLTIPVSCVEQGRWSYQEQRFMSKERVMPSQMRMKKSMAVNASLAAGGSFEADQGAIWDMIDDKKVRFNVDSSTSAMGDIYEHEKDSLNDYMKHFEVVDNQAGILVMINDRIAGCDCFGKYNTFSKTFPKIIKSYAFDAIDVNEGKDKYMFSKKKASGFMNDISSCLIKGGPSVSMGTDLRLVSEKVIGSALAVENELIHLTAFAKEEKVGDKASRKGTRV